MQSKNCFDCGSKISHSDFFCSECGRQVRKLVENEKYCRDTALSTRRQIKLRRCLKAAPIGLIAGLLTYASFPGVSFDSEDLTLYIFPGISFVVAIVSLGHAFREISEKEYYKISGARYENGDHRCIYCGHRGRNGGGIYTHGEYKENTKYHECSKCNGLLFVS